MSAPRREWPIEVGGSTPQTFRWRDDGGAVDLSDARVTVTIAWAGGSFTLSSDPGGGVTKKPQTDPDTRGMFEVLLTAPQRLALPRDWPADYSIAVERWEQRQVLVTGRIVAIAEAGA